MKIQAKIQPRFPTGPLTVLDMPLDSGFMRGVLVQDRSQAGNHGTAVNGPVPAYPGFDFVAASVQSIGDATQVVTAYPFTICAWFNASVLNSEQDVGGTGLTTEKNYAGLKQYNWEGAFRGGVGMNNGTNGKAFRSNDDVVAGQWYSLVGVFNGFEAGDNQGYQDAVLMPHHENNRDGLSAAHDSWKIGGPPNDGTTSDPFDGRIAMFQIHLRSFTAVEVLNWHNLTKHKFGV